MMPTDAAIGIQIAFIAQYASLVVVVLLCLYLFIASLTRASPTKNWSSCGKCGHAATTGVSRCAECGSDYARVGIVTRAMDYRMRVSPWVAGTAWSALVLCALLYGAVWFERVFPSVTFVTTNASTYVLTPDSESRAELRSLTFSVSVLTYGDDSRRGNVTWTVSDASNSAVYGRAEIDLATQQVVLIDANAQEFARGGSETVTPERVEKWIAACVSREFMPSADKDRFVRSLTEHLQASLSRPHQLQDVAAKFGDAGELNWRQGSQNGGLVREVDWNQAPKFGLLLAGGALIWGAGITLIYRKQRIQAHTQDGPA
jgi:hypothetical protein